MDDLISRWSHYFLRYCVGTVLGAIIVLFLANHLVNGDNPLTKYVITQNTEGKTELGAAAITIFIALGFAYCYIASAPGTVFHAARGIFYQRKLSWLPGFALIFPALCCLVALCWLFLRPPGFLASMPLKRSLMLFVGCGAGVVIFWFQCVLLVLVFTNRDHVRKFYAEMTKARSEKANNIQHYRKSYRDLREHGNAFEIIILEFILAATLLFLKPYCLIVLTAWVLPAAFCWIIGTLLEFTIPAPSLKVKKDDRKKQ